MNKSARNKKTDKDKIDANPGDRISHRLRPGSVKKTRSRIAPLPMDPALEKAMTDAGSVGEPDLPEEPAPCDST